MTVTMHPKHREEVRIWFIKGSLYGFVFDNLQIKASNLLEIDNKNAALYLSQQQRR